MWPSNTQPDRRSGGFRSFYQRLEERRPKLQTYNDYYEGGMSSTSRQPNIESFGPMFDGFADNWCDLVVDVQIERRLNIKGSDSVIESVTNRAGESGRRTSATTKAG